MLLTVILLSVALFILLVAGLVWGIFEWFKEKKLKIEQDKNKKDMLDLNNRLNISMERNTNYYNENANFHEEINKLRKENIDLRNSNNELLKENYHLKDKNKILDAKNLELEQDFAKLIPINKELFAENNILRETNNKYLKQIETLQMKVEAQESFVRGANMGYAALSACNPNFFKPDVPISTTVVVEEVDEEIKKSINLT